MRVKIMLSAGRSLATSTVPGWRRPFVQAPETELVGFGGRKMAQAGVMLAADFASYNVMGVWEVLKSLGRIRRLLQRLTDFMREERPDLLVLIDYPDFNWRLAARAEKLGIPVFSYIPPSAWAWRKGRAKACAKLAEEFVAIFPHELPVYEAAGAKISFVGNPLVDTVHAEISAQERGSVSRCRKARTACCSCRAAAARIELLLPDMLGAAKRLLRERPGTRFYLPWRTVWTRARCAQLWMPRASPRDAHP